MEEQEQLAAQTLRVQELSLRVLLGGGKVTTTDEALSVMEKYKNLYNMPANEQKAFTDSFSQAVLDTYNKKKEAAEATYLKKTKEAMSQNDKKIYDNATSVYNTRMKNIQEERKLIQDMYNSFIKVK